MGKTIKRFENNILKTKSELQNELDTYVKDNWLMFENLKHYLIIKSKDKIIAKGKYDTPFVVTFSTEKIIIKKNKIYYINQIYI